MATGISRWKSILPIKFCESPVATSGDDTYITLWTNMTGNDEVMFRASDNGGATFTDKINVIVTLGIAITLATSLLLLEQQQKDPFKAEDGQRSMTI